MTENVQDNIKDMSFEQALAALERIVDDLEKGDVPLNNRSVSTSAARASKSTVTPC